MANYTTHPCPNCKDEAPRVLEGFAFQFEAGGSAPGNSGVHDHDFPTADKMVGRSAAERWTQHHEREKVKTEARRLGGTHALIRHTTPDFIAYEPMSPTGIQARRGLAKAVFEAARASRPEQK